MTALALEDLRVGQQFRSARVALSLEEITRFARDNDPQYFHVDEEAAKDSMFGRLIASGWQTAALAIRLLLDTMGGAANGIVGTETKVVWRQPVYPGDGLYIEATITHIRRSKMKPDRGFVMVDIEMFNDAGAIVMTQKITVVAFSRER